VRTLYCVLQPSDNGHLKSLSPTIMTPEIRLSDACMPLREFPLRAEESTRDANDLKKAGAREGRHRRKCVLTNYSCFIYDAEIIAL
jgi:hypothetical protein